MKHFILFVTLTFLTFQIGLSQERYLEEIFDDVSVSSNVMYGLNSSVITVPDFGSAFDLPLMADIYEPVGDTETSRPLVIYFHTGNFLPYPQNSSPSGTKTDSTAVAICSRLAKMGYVVASVDYRLGWNPVSEIQEVRVNTLINAAYRGVQDSRNAVRYFKKTVAEDSNPYGIDDSKIVLWGQGTGGYITLASASLDDYAEVLLPKFTGSNMLPMVLEPVNGDIYGTSYGIVPAGTPGFPAEGDTLCIPNHASYDSDFQMAVNLGGALGDSSWLDPGVVPIVSFHAPSDLFAPYEEATLNVAIPGGGSLPVVEVQGSYIVQDLQNEYGNHDAWLEYDFIDAYSTRANEVNDGLEGLFPIIRPEGSLDSSPWDFWAEDNVNNDNGLLTNPDMSAAKAHTYIDTLLGYYAPRACITLDLGCDLVTTGFITGIEETTLSAPAMTVSPNPASNVMTFTTNEYNSIQEIQLFDIEGRLVRTESNIRSKTYQFKRNDLNTGIYIAEIILENGITVSERIIFE